MSGSRLSARRVTVRAGTALTRRSEVADERRAGALRGRVAAKQGFPAARMRAVRRRLLHWYDLHRRDLPWRRRSGNAYAQWVAEIMLQQTQVETVRSYYERFLQRFPDVRALGAARLDDVLKAWEGLGYYRRAVNLHAAAQHVSANGGRIPATADGLRALPGIGAYTSAAIASIAHGEPVAAVDGNVLRVLTRLLGLASSRAIGPNAQDRQTRASVQFGADQVLDRARPGDFNQAWMDLGALICRPRQPRCGECPLADVCVGRTPATTRQPAAGIDFAGHGRGMRVTRTPRVVQTVLLVQRGDSLLMRQRPPSGLWAGLWEFPTLEARGAGEVTAALAALGLRSHAAPRPLGELEHQLTHRRFVFRPLLVRIADRDGAARVTGRWVDRAQRAELAISTAHRKILARLDSWMRADP